MIFDRIRRITRDGRWIPEIDGLRFIAIFSVLLFHLGGELANRSGRFIPIEARYARVFLAVGNGDRGVRLFFVISGMILAMPFARQFLTGAKKVSLRKYYLRRVTRLEPPYVLSMVFFTVALGIYAGGHLEAGYFGHAVASTFYLHNLIFATSSPVNPVTWSLEVEIQFYLLAPLVMLLFRIGGKTARRLVMAVSILAIGLMQTPFLDHARFILSILFYAQYFIAGLLLADIFVLDLEKMRSSWLWDVAGVAGLVFLYGAEHDSHAVHVALPFVIGLVCLAAMRSFLLREFVANPWVAVIGGMCYSIYLMHFALMAVIFKITRYVIVPRFDFLANFAIQLIVTGVPILLLCTVFYMLVERPCMDPDWPSKLWHRLSGRSGNEVLALDAGGISEEESPVVES